MPYANQFARWQLYLCVFLGCLPLLASATHIVGGHLEMKALGDKPGHFRISLVYCFDELQAWPAAANALIVIYRKQDNQLIDSLRIDNQTINGRPPVIFANEACATQAKMKISLVRYEGDVQLNPNTYTDPSGYYLAYQTCCRNGGITNIQRPNRAGYVYYLEFPPLIKDGKAVTNSSPAFGTLDGEYICINKPFRFNFNASDTDGDQLRYSITTPLYGFQDANGNPYIRAAPYPEVQWIAGYGPDNTIPGNPPLSINPQTGELSVTATKLGLFVFAIRVEEFRNGEKIGEIRRDYQFLVTDCPTAIPPTASIAIQNQPTGATEANLCEGKSAELQATVNKDWHYQWKINGSNITGATSPTITVTEPGEYSLETSLKNQCSQSQRSTKVTIKRNTSVLKLAVEGKLCSPTDKVTLKAPAGTSYSYIWYLDKQEQTNQTTALFTTSQPGHYTALVKDPAGCVSHTDTVTLSIRIPPQATITSSASALCQGDSVALQGGGGITYVWNLNNQVIPNALKATFYARQPGTYSVSVSDSAGCSATSQPISLSVVTKINVTLDSLKAICGTNGSPISLNGYPAGGVFAGIGTADSHFDPSKAGVGQHLITYTVKGVSACQSGSASRYVAVNAVPSVTLPPELSTSKGGTVDLRPVLTSQPVHSQWQPTTYLTDPTQPITQATGVDNDISYTLQIEDAEGCRAEATVHVVVRQRIGIPDAFTPNGDGVNEVWELKGIDAYPEAELTIYNRWGQIIFYTNGGYSQPFNGIFNGQKLPDGAYTYTLKPTPKQAQNINGVVLLIR
ncbi:gliding motility-associated C-terminal domain-containing protein [Spirosoma validum]|uniref:Gliding motility-associated C-terminal domain-containing protein n=1 Tax=Spirosoma validum TaxID=2771355 RepID=A0A927B5U2_9BACT|nr:gliding motility-associated C-terminal domain-containing protein [Spirosoma validum]MBD2756215.1 gliding motility-associated C-terminal domain-containing protein [Spirosoma validum]